MKRFARQESGFTLIELLLVSVLTTVILGATMAVFASMERNQKMSRETNELQDDTRNVVDQIAKQLRNVASPSENAFQPIERADSDDVIFRVVSRTGTPTASNPSNIMRVRYCLDNNQRLYAQTQLLADASSTAPAGQACPLSGAWSTQRLINGQITNGTRPVFTYVLTGASPNLYEERNDVTSTGDLERIVSIRTQIFADDDVTKTPPESSLSTRVFLRNQNIKPSASFTASPTGTMSLQLNGSASEDPEGGALTFEWFDTSLTGNQKIGEGPIYTYSPAAAGNKTIYLRVTDPGGNFGVSPIQTFRCATSTGCTP